MLVAVSMVCAVACAAAGEEPRPGLDAPCLAWGGDGVLADWPAELAACAECPYVVTPAAGERLQRGAPPATAPTETIRRILVALDRGVGLQVWWVEGVMVWLADADEPGLPSAAARRFLRMYPPEDDAEPVSAETVERTVRAWCARSPVRVAGEMPGAVDVRRRLDHISEAQRLCGQEIAPARRPADSAGGRMSGRE